MIEDVKLKLSALWVSLLFFYVYADILGFYAPGNIEALITGEIGGIQITQLFLFGSALLMASKSLMIILCLTLRVKANRQVNIILGIVCAVVLCITFFVGEIHAYYMLYGIVEGVILALIVWHAWKWPDSKSGCA
ncbi:MAG: DUF6326 family protein [Candidatus Thorarchaeota archaeon]